MIPALPHGVVGILTQGGATKIRQLTRCGCGAPYTPRCVRSPPCPSVSTWLDLGTRAGSMRPVLDEVRSIYLATRKRHDQLFNVYVMRPLAAGAVAVLAPTSITPNQLTLVSLGVLVVAAMLL